MQDKRVLITGAAGLLGATLMQEWQGRYECVGTYHINRPLVPWEMVPFNLEDPLDVLQAVRKVKPDVVVHCAAYTDVDKAERYGGLAWAINTQGTEYLANACAAPKIKLVYISTDAVFDGTKGNYSETDTPNPVNVYAKTKLAGEIASTLYCDDTLIVRTNIYGHSLDPERPSAVDRLLATLEKGEEYKAWVNVTTSPILVNDLADALYHLIEAGCSGVYHVCSTYGDDRGTFARTLAHYCKVQKELVQDDTLEFGDRIAKRPKDTTLNVDKALRVLAGKGYTLPGIHAGIKRFAAMRGETCSET